MGRPFTCSVCGVTTRRRSHFFWLVDVVAYLNGQVSSAGEDPVCQRCAPRWSTTLGFVIYLLVGICFLLVVWQFKS